jgi:hypothetical protein
VPKHLFSPNNAVTRLSLPPLLIYNLNNTLTTHLTITSNKSESKMPIIAGKWPTVAKFCLVPMLKSLPTQPMSKNQPPANFHNSITTNDHDKDNGNQC